MRLQCRKKIDEISSVSEDMTTVLIFFCHQMLLNERWIHPRSFYEYESLKDQIDMINGYDFIRKIEGYVIYEHAIFHRY